MIKEIGLIGVGIALKDKQGRKMILNIAKNGSKMIFNELNKATGINLDKTFKELIKSEENTQEQNTQESEVK